jgi:hypothetical protein
MEEKLPEPIDDQKPIEEKYIIESKPEEKIVVKVDSPIE